MIVDGKYYVSDIESGQVHQVSKENYEAYKRAWQAAEPRGDQFRGFVYITGTGGEITHNEELEKLFKYSTMNQEMQEKLDKFKTEYKPKEGYSILLFITGNEYYIAIYKKQLIHGKKDGDYIAELAFKQNKFKKLEELADNFKLYLTKINETEK